MKDNNNDVKRLRQKAALSYQAAMRSAYVAAENAQLAERAMRIAAVKRAHDHILHNHLTPAAVEYLSRFENPLDVLADHIEVCMTVNVDVDLVLQDLYGMNLGLDEYKLDPEYVQRQDEALQLTDGTQEEQPEQGQSQTPEGQPHLAMGEVSM